MPVQFIVNRRRRTAVAAGGPALPIIRRYVPGDDLAAKGGVFTRASTATFVDVNGVVQTAASGTLRDAHYIGGERTALVESEARTNGALDSGNFMGASWGMGGQAGRTQVGAPLAPDGVTVSTLLRYSGAGPDAVIYQATGAAANLPVALSVFAKQAVGSWLRIQANDTGIGTPTSWVNLANGAIGTKHANHSIRVVALANGWYRVSCVATPSAGASISYAAWAPATGDGQTNAAGAGYDIALHGGQIENGATIESSYIPTTSAAVTRAADRLYFTIDPLIIELSALVDGYMLWPEGTPGARRLYNLGGDNDPRIISAYANGPDRWQSRPRLAGSEALHEFAMTLAYGDRIEHHVQLADDGNATSTIVRNGGAPAVLGPTDAGVMVGNWSAGRIYVGTDEGNSAMGRNLVALRKLLFVEGLESLATLRAG